MKVRLGLYLAILAVPSMGSPIDVSADTRALVRTGDTLIFHLLTSNFRVDAVAFGGPLHPSEVSFALVSSTGVAGDFSATLESADREVSAAFGQLIFAPGYFEGDGYTGEVSSLQGRLSLSPELSEVFFSSPSAVIVLRNGGPDVTLGLAPYLLRQDLYASLSGGPFSVGAVTGSVDLESPERRRSVIAAGALNFPVDSTVPEPQSGGLFLLGGALLYGISAILPRISRVAALLHEKSTVCIR